jgi:hypothetical protein
MHEQEKLGEASYFLTGMIGSLNSRDAFKYGLSAFLSAARSVLQYALDEAKTKAGGKAWYDAQARNPIIKFFKGKRDVNIHYEPVVPTANTNIKLYEALHVAESVSVKIVDKNGNVVQGPTNAPPPAPPKTSVPPSSVSISYSFSDWTGPEDVVALSSKYLAALDAVVKDGVANGYLIPQRPAGQGAGMGKKKGKRKKKRK